MVNYFLIDVAQVYRVYMIWELALKGVVNCQNSRDKGPPEGNSARG